MYLVFKSKYFFHLWMCILKSNNTAIRFGWDSPLTVEEEHGVEMEVVFQDFPFYK